MRLSIVSVFFLLSACAFTSRESRPLDMGTVSGSYHPIDVDDVPVKEHRHARIEVPQKIFYGCYVDNAKVQSFGAPSQEDYAKALERESEVHNNCTKLQRETAQYLSQALGELRNGN